MPTSWILALLRELKRRNVFRVAVVYAAVSFVLAQVADIAFPALHLPSWTVTFVIVLIILGFPVALVLAWAFEITPEGMVRTGRPARAEDGDGGAHGGQGTEVGLGQRQGGAADGDREALAGGGAGEVPGLGQETGAGGPPAGASAAAPQRGVWTPGRIGAVAGAAVVVALVAGGTLVFFGNPSTGAESRVEAPEALGLERSIAVLPFTDLSPGRDHEWFSDGITEDILIHLAHLGDLKVIGRTSVMRYKGRDVGARQIGVELGVAAIVAGSVRRAGDQVRVSAELISAATDQQLWADSFDRDLTDIFEIQSEIARSIAQTLHARLSPAEDRRLARAPTESLEGYDHYLRGREHNQRLTQQDLLAAMDSFRRAMALDPEFAQAYAGIAFSFGAMYGYHHDGRHWADSAFAAARKAVELDPDGADGYSVLALAQWNSGQLGEAVETYGRALALRPGDAESFWGLAFTRWIQGELPEALRMARRSTDLDPGHPGHATLRGRIHASLGDLEGAEHWYRYAMSLQADFPWAHQDLLWVLIGHGEYRKAEEHLRTIPNVPAVAREYHQGTILLALHRGDYQAAADHYDGIREWMSGGILRASDMGFVFARLGEEERARELLQQATRLAAVAEPLRPDDHQVSVAAESLGRTAAAAGDPEEALTWLGMAHKAGWLGFPWLDIARDPVLEDLRGDPRFQGIRDAILQDVERMRRLADAEGLLSFRLPQP